ncbi:MAG: hypothetical protein WC992_09015 [Acholeplasmataceae bacterium]
MKFALGAWTATGTSSVAVTADDHRDGLAVQNHASSTHAVYLGPGQTAMVGQGIELAPGGGVTLHGHMARLRLEAVTAPAGAAAGGFQAF